MALYIIHMIEILITGVIIQPNDSKLRRGIYVVLQSIFFILIYTLRDYTVGRDTFQFIVAFNVYNGRTATGIYYDRTLEGGFEWLCKFVGNYSLDYHVLFLVVSVILFCSIGIYFYNNSHDVVLSVYLFTTMTMFSFILSSVLAH